MKEFIPSILELQPSRFGLKKGVKTPEDMKNALTKLSISISVSKEEILSGIDKYFKVFSMPYKKDIRQLINKIVNT